MTQKNILVILPIMLSILLIPNIGMSFADHPGENGGGCTGDCIPPTLGKDSSGKVFVENGFTLNGKSYDVEHSKQTLPTQIVHDNEPVEITLRVYENSGPQVLNHVGIVLGNEYVFETAVWMHLPNAEIVWEKSFDGIQSVEVKDENHLVTDVNVVAKVDGDSTILKFQFTPTMVFDTSHIMVKMWDQKRNYWVNNLYNGLEIKYNPFSQKTNVIAPESHEVLTDDPDKLHQDEIHDDDHDSHNALSAEDLNCDENSKPILDSRFDNSFCAPVNVATALIESGLANLV